jgi:hypothetical protein|tara:strand:- start:154 stop:324 length:171 start_codon:yes stop_codon:yes gene_type:complete
MAKKKRKDIPFHIAHNYKQWDSTEGYKFWARDEEGAKLYCEHMGWTIGSLKEQKEK